MSPEAAWDAAEEVAHDLLGTCKSLQQALEDYAEKHGIQADDMFLNDTFTGVLDDNVWECSSCGWWVETHDTNEDGVCGGCREDDEDDY